MSKWNDAVPDRETQHEMKREALYKEAAKAFNRKGFRGTSLAELAEELGITKAALYHYVPNKHELLYRCLYNSTTVSLEAVARAKKEEKTGLEIIRRAIYYYFVSVLSFDPPSVTIYDDSTLDDEHAKIIYDRRKKLTTEMRQIVEDGIKDGSIAECDPRLTVSVIGGTLNWTTRWYAPDGEKSPEEMAKGIADMMARSIAAVPS